MDRMCGEYRNWASESLRRKGGIIAGAIVWSIQFLACGRLRFYKRRALSRAGFAGMGFAGLGFAGIGFTGMRFAASACAASGGPKSRFRSRFRALRASVATETWKPWLTFCASPGIERLALHLWPLLGLASIAMSGNPSALGYWKIGDLGGAFASGLQASAVPACWLVDGARCGARICESNRSEIHPSFGRCGPISILRSDRRGDKKELEGLRRKLNDSDPSKRRTAVNGLARLGDEDAWQLVLEALADADGRVADQAQLRLGESASPVVLMGLLGRQGLRAKDDWVRRRSAEALGRFQGAVKLSDWIRALGDREVAVRSTVCWSLERIAQRSLLPTDEGGKLQAALRKRLEHDKEPAVRARALFALAAMQCETLDELLLSAMKDRRRSTLRCAALLLVSKQARSGSALVQNAARQLLRDPEQSVRAACIAMLGECGNAADMLALAGTLSSEERLRLRWRAVAVLRRNSGLKYGLNPRPWQAWAARLPTDWMPAPARRADETGSVAFDGLPVLSDRLTFLVDFSGSLWNARENGLTRKQFADQEVERALGKLTEASKFNLVPYTGEPHPWRDELQVGRSKLLREALQWFQSNRESGQGNVCAAIETALQDPLVDSLVIMTDGAPTGGRRWNLELMIDELIEANRLRCLAFDIVLVDAPGGLVRHWRRLAESSGGELAEVRME